MKAKIRFSIILMFLFTAFLVNGQEAQKAETTPSGSGTKAQDHNSSRSNKTASSVAPDNTPEGGETNTLKANHKSAAAEQDQGSGEKKKGYDYYKAQSDMKSAGSQSKAQDHNSSRSNKSSSKVAEDPGAGEGNSKSVDDKTDKSEAARAKRK